MKISKMDEEFDKETLPLTALTYTSMKTLTLLLSTNKVIPTEGPEKLPRDWRGLAALIKISSEVTASINDNSTRVPKLIEIWLHRKDDTATIGTLFQYLQRLDRFDVYDDLVELDKLGQLVQSRTTENNAVSRQLGPLDNLREDFITYDDVKHNSPQYYHALVLYAKEDQEFVDELLSRMKSYGFKLCTEDDLLPGHSTQYAPVSQLMSKRCHRIILIYSPDFLESPANIFFRDYAQAISIEMKKPKIIPCMYRQCQLPAHLTFYHKLYYSPPNEKSIYNFWDKLGQALEMVNLPRLQTPGTTQKAINISQYKSFLNTITTKERTGFLNQPTAEVQTTTPERDSQSSSNLSEGQRKKFTTLRKIMNNLKGKKEKVVMVEN